MKKTTISDDIFTIVLTENWWYGRSTGSKGSYATNISFFTKRFKIIGWFLRYFLGVFVIYRFVAITDAQPVEDGFEYYIRITSKNYYLLWFNYSYTNI